MTLVEQWNRWRQQVSKDIILYQRPIDLAWAEDVNLRWENLWWGSLTEKERESIRWQDYISEIYGKVLDWLHENNPVNDDLAWEYEMMTHGEGFNYEEYKILGKEIQQHRDRVEKNFRNLLLEMETKYGARNV